MAIQDTSDWIGFSFRATTWDFFIACDNVADDWPIIAHELGHAVLKFDDYYFEKGRVTSGNIYYWGLMGDGELGDPPAPIFCQNKIIKNWLKEKAYTLVLPLIFYLKNYSDLQYKDEIISVRPLSGAGWATPYYYLEARKEYPSNDPDWWQWRNDKPGIVIYKHYIKLFGLLPWGFTEAIKGKHSTDKQIIYPTLYADDPSTTGKENEYFDPQTGMKFIYHGLQVKDGEYKHKVEVKYSLSDYANLQGTIVKTLIDNGQSLSVAINQSADIDLHAYTENGLHVGLNYTTGEYECEIPGAVYSGDQFIEEYILVPKGTKVRFEVVMKGNINCTLNYTTCVIESGENPSVNVTEDGNIVFHDWNVSAEVLRNISTNETKWDLDEDGIPFYAEIENGTDPNEGTIFSEKLSLNILSLPDVVNAGRLYNISFQVLAGEVPINATINITTDEALQIMNITYEEGIYHLKFIVNDSQGSIINITINASRYGFISNETKFQIYVIFLHA